MDRSTEMIRQRHSIRGFKSTPVPKALLEKILDTAVYSPSGMNSQPWEFTVIAGQVLKSICQGNVAKLAADVAPNSEVSAAPFQGIYRERQVALAMQIFELMGITREDKQKRSAWAERGFRFFDAPAAIILSVDKTMESPQAFSDLGAIRQCICLAALDYDLGTCIHGQGVMFPEVIRQFTPISESKTIVTCISIGYPDWDFPANKLISNREPASNITTWLGFDQ